MTQTENEVANEQGITDEPTAAESVTAENAEPSKKNRKKKYSKGLRDIQRFERGMTKASHRVVGAVEKGLQTYRRRSEKSARKRRDGALRDSVTNLAVATSETLAESAKVPLDLVESLDTKRVWKRVRPVLRAMTRPIFLR